MDDLDARYYVPLGAAFARGRIPELAERDDRAAFEEAVARGLRMHKFKRNAELPRVRRVLSMLAGLAPESLLDVGSGRGVFLWPLLDAFPSLAVTAIDREERRAEDLAAVSRGGVESLTARRMDAERLDFADRAFDGVTILEVLEHVADPDRAAREMVRVARRFVVATVPSKHDENPEHIRLFDRDSLVALFSRAGAKRVGIEHVLGHMVVLAMVPS